MATLSVAKTERMRRILEEAVNRFNNELMDDEERQLLLDRIKRLRRRLAASSRQSLRGWPSPAPPSFS